MKHLTFAVCIRLEQLLIWLYLLGFLLVLNIVGILSSLFLYKYNQQIIYSSPTPKYGDTNEHAYSYIQTAVRIKDDGPEFQGKLMLIKAMILAVCLVNSQAARVRISLANQFVVEEAILGTVSLHKVSIEQSSRSFTRYACYFLVH